MHKLKYIIFGIMLSLFIIIPLFLVIQIYNGNYKFINSTSNTISHFTNGDFKQKEEQLNNNLPPVGRLNNNKGGSHGTAFIIDSHTIITNDHIVNDASRNNLAFLPHRNSENNSIIVPNQNTHITDIHHIKNKDVAVLNTKESLKPFGKITLTSETPKVYDKTITYGYPDPRLNIKQINDSKMTKTTFTYISTKNKKGYVKGIIHPGASGSPMINKHNEAYGIATFRHSDDDPNELSGGYIFTPDLIDEINQHKQ